MTEPAATPPPDPKGPPTAAPTSAEAKALALSINGFGFALYNAANGASEQNFALSPASVSTALTMTAAGSDSSTWQEMKSVLRLAGNQSEAAMLSGKLSSYLTTRASQTQLAVANRLFGEQTYAFEKPFLELSQRAFGAPLEKLDFAKQAEPARLHINGWVAQQTQQRIKDLIPPRAIDADTRLVLTNAIYFLGDWQTPFKKESTRETPFSTASGDKKNVPTMHGYGRFSYANTHGLQALALPYVGDDMAMTLLLPEASGKLSDLEKRMDVALLDQISAAMADTQVAIALPKFEISGGALALSKTLKGLGMTKAFSSKEADFRGISKPADPDDRLYIGEVFHKTYVRVDEKGTEAAAATAVVMPRAGSAAPKFENFTADRPFLFLIRDTKTQAVLFLGRVADPTQKG